MVLRRRSGREGELSARDMAAPSAGLLFQRTLDRAGAAEQLPVHRVEPVVGCVEHESARHADGNADRAPVELDGKTLGNHLDSWLPAGGARVRACAAAQAAARLLDEEVAHGRSDARFSGEAPGAGCAGALESCRAALGMEELGPSELIEIGHRVD